MALEITLEELQRIESRKRIIDIRSRDSFEKGTIPHAENIPLDTIDAQKFVLGQNGPVYLLCHTGKLSLDLADELQAFGCEAYSIQGGITPI